MNKQTLTGRIKAMKVGDRLSFSQQDAKHDSIVPIVIFLPQYGHLSRYIII